MNSLLEHERNILCSLLSDKKKFSEGLKSLCPEDFLGGVNKNVFIEIQALSESGQDVTYDTLLYQLRKKGDEQVLPDLFCKKELKESDFTENIRFLKSRTQIRKLKELGHKILTKTKEDPLDVKKLITSCTSDLSAIEALGGFDEKPWLSICGRESYVKVLSDRRDNPSNPRGISSGFKELDSIIGGISPDRLVILAGRPGIGKTSLALNMASKMCIEGDHTIAFLSLEMSAENLKEKIFSAMVKVPQEKLKDGKITPAEKEKVRHLDEILEGKLFVTVSSRELLDRVRKDVKDLKEKHDIKVLFIDYLQLLRGSKKIRELGKYQEVTEISRRLKSIAVENGICII